MLVAISAYQLWFFVHLLGVFGFLLSHGVSAAVALKLRSERDPVRIDALLQLSGSAVPALYGSFLVLLAGGIVAGFLGSWWSQMWIWASIGILVAILISMYAIAGPYYRRVRTIVQAMARGSEAVTAEQLDGILRAPSALWNSILGFAAILAILYLMVFKPF
ncbi:MAG TPA: DUF2269 family protein [Actinomycetota bacterium]|nr:DUF2269 family protein [Actinomycetota bacterium]